MTCHFVYSVPFQGSAFYLRAQRKFRQFLHRRGWSVSLVLDRQPTERVLESWPVRSPYENTRNIYSALAQRARTKLYHLTERVRCGFREDDVLLGHPFFPHQERHYGVTELSARAGLRPRIFALITPLHCDLDVGGSHINREFLEDVGRLLPHADLLFGIMGEYWWDRWDSSPLAAWKPKMVRLDMALDVRRYPRIKTSFNAAGRRGYLYIGTNEPRKGTDVFSELMKQLGNYPCGWVGQGPDIPGIRRISSDRPLTADFMAELGSTYDFFVSAARVDPNPTTILESMAWGFPVVCTPQSGYYETAYRANIFLDDYARSVAVLRRLQYSGEAELVRMANEARVVVETEYNWHRFTSIIVHHLGLDSPEWRSL